jgi:predicted MFS family arabinose efflux permease
MNTPPGGLRQPASLARLLPLCLLVFVDAMGFAMIAPILAAHPLGQGEAVQGILYGVAIGIYPLATFFAAPILGTLSDRAGRLPVMLICGGGLMLSYAGIAIGLVLGSASLVILGRLVGGLTAATQAVALAALGDTGPAAGKDGRLNAGLFSSSLGFVCGPALSGALSGIGSMAEQVVPLAVVVILTAITLIWLRAGGDRQGAETGGLWRAVRQGLGGSAWNPAHGLSTSRLRLLALIFLFQQLGWGAFFFFVAPFLLANLGFSSGAASFYMALLGAGFCLSFAIAMPVLRRFFPVGAIARGSLVLTTLCIFLAALLQFPALQWAVSLPVATAVAVGYGAIIMLFTREAPDRQGEILGATASINALAFGVTSVLSGLIASLGAAAPILCAAVLMAASAVLLLVNLQTKESPAL